MCQTCPINAGKESKTRLGSISLRLCASAGVRQECVPSRVAPGELPDPLLGTAKGMAGMPTQTQPPLNKWQWHKIIPASCHPSRLLASDPTSPSGCLCHRCKSCNRAARVDVRAWLAGQFAVLAFGTGRPGIKHRTPTTKVITTSATSPMGLFKTRSQ